VERDFRYVLLTAPKAAEIFLEAWDEAKRPDLQVACVGAETRRMVREKGLHPFATEHETATGSELIASLPLEKASRVLLPVSVKAGTSLQRELEARGFEVSRLDTYDTVPLGWGADELEMAKAARAVALASPTAIQTWAARMGTGHRVVCLGDKSAANCQAAGFTDVHVSRGIGIEGWADAVSLALLQSRDEH